MPTIATTRCNFTARPRPTSTTWTRTRQPRLQDKLSLLSGTRSGPARGGSLGPDGFTAGRGHGRAAGNAQAGLIRDQPSRGRRPAAPRKRPQGGPGHAARDAEEGRVVRAGAGHPRPVAAATGPRDRRYAALHRAEPPADRAGSEERRCPRRHDPRSQTPSCKCSRSWPSWSTQYNRLNEEQRFDGGGSHRQAGPRTCAPRAGHPAHGHASRQILRQARPRERRSRPEEGRRLRAMQ